MTLFGADATDSGRNTAARDNPPMSFRDQRGIVADWLVKLVIGFVVFGVIIFDSGSILVNYFTLDSSAEEVAQDISLTVLNSGGPANFTDEEIFELAKTHVQHEEDGVEGARVLRMGTTIDEIGVVHVRLRRTADTLIVKRIGAIEKWARATADGQAGTT